MLSWQPKAHMGAFDACRVLCAQRPGVQLVCTDLLRTRACRITLMPSGLSRAELGSKCVSRSGAILTGGNLRPLLASGRKRASFSDGLGGHITPG